MAQGPVAALQSTPVPAMATGIAASLSEEEKHQIRECERIVHFQDDVLSGAHPRIRPLAHLVASKQSSEPRSPPSPAIGVSNAPAGSGSAIANSVSTSKGSQIANNLRSFNANDDHSVMPASHHTTGHLPGLGPVSDSSSNVSGIPTGPWAVPAKRVTEQAGNVQFDPIFLTKSDDLIKAELQLQRQRLERALSDQLHQHKTTSKNSHAEALADFDLADVLMKALQLVQSSAPQQTDANLAANASGAESDSFDDNTFYSSNQDTPESHQTHRIPEPEPEGAQVREDSHYEPPMIIEASPLPGQPPAVVIPPSHLRNANTAEHQQHRQTPAPAPAPDSRSRTLAKIYHSENQTGAGMGVGGDTVGLPMEITSSQESGQGSSSRYLGQADGGPPSSRRRLEPVSQQLIDQAFGHRQSPILRSHNLSPVAPQPAHVSSLAVSRQPPMPQHEAPQAQAPPAQVAALRNDRSNGSSPESSPQGRPNKKGKKNKKRKADRMSTTNVPSPYIKPEPRSPSPLSAPQFPRSNKRLRQAQRVVQEHDYDEPLNEEVVEITHPHSYHSRVYREDRVASVYESPLGHHARQDSRPIVLTESPRYEREYRDDLRSAEAVQYVRRVSPPSQPYPHNPSEVHPIRSVSRAAIDRPYSYYDSRDPLRTVFRPLADRDRSRSPIRIDEPPPTVMGPPRLPSSRVVVDEFGREYIDPSSRPEPVVVRRSIAPRPAYGEREEFYEPPRSTARVIRRSVAPASVRGEPEVIFERPHPSARSASTVPGPSRYDEEVLYRRPGSPSGYATSRRIVTRSEYAAPEYRSYYRERDYPNSQAGDGYYEVRSTQERPPVDEPPREYIVRSTTVRPEVPSRPEVIRLSSVRPEPVAGEYGAPIHVDDRPMPPPRAYSVRPMAPPQQQYNVRQWPEYDARPYGGEQEVRGEGGGLGYLESAPRDIYR